MQALILVNSSPGFLYVPIISIFCSVIGFKLKLVSQSIILPTRKRNQNQPTLFPGSSLFLFPRGGGMKRTLGAKCIFPSEEEKRVRYFMSIQRKYTSFCLIRWRVLFFCVTKHWPLCVSINEYRILQASPLQTEQYNDYAISIFSFKFVFKS